MGIKDRIIDYIKSNEAISEDKDGSFFNTIIPAIEKCNEDSIIENIIDILIVQSALYDTLLNNISVFGDKILIKRCIDDITELLSCNINFDSEK